MSAPDQHIRFCTADDGVRLAYATVGEGPPLVKAANWLGHLQYEWQSPVWRHWLHALARDHTLVRYDERGCGLSDWEVEDISFEAWVRDLELVVDALELERFPLLGLSQGGPVAVAYAVRHPERVSRLILYGTYDIGWGQRPEASSGMQWEALATLIRHGWAQDNPAFRQVFTALFIPDGTPEQARWFDDLQRVTTSPEIAERFEWACSQIDVRDLLPRVQAPALVLHARGDATVPFTAGQRLAEALPDARFVPLEGKNHVLLEHEPAWPRFLAEVRAFLGVETAPRRAFDPAERDPLSALFERALAAPPDERRAVLDGIGDPALRAEIESLLVADAEATGGAFLTAPPAALLEGAVAESVRRDIIEGTTVAHYRIGKRLGGGGMGVVYRALDTRLDRTVALKFLPPHLSYDEEVKRRFIREAKAASALDQPNICTIHDIVDTAAGRLFIAMACYEGETLRDKIERGPLPVDEAVGYAVQIADGLGRAHEAGIVHRDVKPANVMVTERGGVKLLDFGIARVTGSDVTKAGATMGTVAYMSPEQTRGHAVDHRTDLWSLGVVLYELLSGVRPFRGGTDQAVVYAVLNEEPVPLGSLRPDVPSGIQHIVLRLLAKDPNARFPRADEVADALRRPSPAAIGGAGTGAREAASIAVLPFVDMSPGRDQAYFCEGIAEELINALARIDGLRVASRTSSFAVRNTSADVREIGERLQVSAILEGGVRRAGDRLRVTVQLVDVGGGYHRWSERYDGDLAGVFAMQDEIAESTVRALRGVLTEEDREAIQKAPSADIEAYDYYLQGRQFLPQGNRRSLENARRLFERAAAVDPAYAPAYAGIASCSYYLYLWSRESEADREAARQASRRAVALAPQLAESHVALGLALTLDERFEEAEQAMEEALRLNSQSYDAHYFYGRLCFQQGKLEQTARLFERAAALDPNEYQAACLLAQVYESLGHTEAAQAQYRTGFERAQRHLELNPNDVRAISLGAAGLLMMGRRERGLEWMRRAADMAPEDPIVAWNTACNFSKAGETEAALDHLERAAALGIADRRWLEHDPDMDSLRGHPRFITVLESMGHSDEAEA